MAEEPKLPAVEYARLETGPGFERGFEIQPGVPVDGTSTIARMMSPFILRVSLPDALRAYAVEIAENNPDVFSNATQGAQGGFRESDNSRVSDLVASGFTSSNLTAVVSQRLDPVIANGVLVQGRGEAFDEPMFMTRAAVADLVVQLQQLASTPPLVLMVNPESMQITYTKIQNYATRVRHGYIFEAWGEELPKLSFTASTGGFIAGAASSANLSSLTGQRSGETSSVSGLQYFSKPDSAAWQNFMQLYSFYRNNGYIYDRLGGSEAHLFVGSISIEYDQFIYVGNFDSFAWQYSADSPHRIQGFTFEFTVSAIFDRAPVTRVVLPLQSPVPSPGDPRWSPGSRFSGNAGGLVFANGTSPSPQPEQATTPTDFPA